MRTFVAIITPPSGPVPAFLDDCRRRLDAGRPDVKWVAAPHRHVTLRFLGEVDEDSLAAVKQATLDAAAAAEPFEAALTAWGAFPDALRPQTLWAGVTAADNAIQRLERALDMRLGAADFPPERKPFHPHITLGRVRSPRGIDAVVQALRSPRPPLEAVTFSVDHLTLFESVLTPAGPNYTVLLDAPLGSGPNPVS